MARVPLDERVDKVVVTNVEALRAKYDARGLDRVRAALRTLVAADQARDLTTAVVDVSSRATAARVGADRVGDVADHEATTRFVDALCQRTTPDYVMLLGGPDVVAHVPLANPLPSPDPDPDVPSDLPYACSTGSGTDASAFLGSDRVVGRLPDAVGVRGPGSAGALAAAIRSAARWTGSDPDRYRDHLTLSTARWQRSTRATAVALFGAGAVVHHAPPVAQPLAPPDLAKPLHLINLHGATADVRWLGDPGFAPVHDSHDARRHARPGTVVVSEACFGGELFDAALTGDGLPFPLAYLAAGAYGAVGSTCISYGGRLAPDAADVLCRYVIEELLGGASLGRAMLQARQRYVHDQPVMTPVDLKTLAQFNLFADPSVHPVATAVTGTRTMRRRNLAAAGPSIASSTAVVRGTGSRPAPGAARLLRTFAAAGRPAAPVRSFDVVAEALPAARLPAQRIHVAARRLATRAAVSRLEVRELSEDERGLHLYRTLESKGPVPGG